MSIKFTGDLTGFPGASREPPPPPAPPAARGLTDWLWALAATDFKPSALQSGEPAQWTSEFDPRCTFTGTAEERIAALLKTKSFAAKINPKKVTFADLHGVNVEKLSAAWPPNPDAKSGLPYDGSSVDQAYFNHVAWGFGNNCEAIEQYALSDKCPLHRQKWDERPDYIRSTILKAVAIPKIWKARRNAPAAAPVAPLPPPVVVPSLNFGAPLPPPARSTATNVLLPTTPTAGTSTPPPASGAILPADTGVDERIDIYLEGGQLDIYAELCEKMLGTGQHVYSRGGGLVRLGRAAELPSVKTVDGITTDVRGVKRAAAQLVPVEATHGWLIRKLMKLARFHIYTKQGYERADCPSTLVGNITDQKLWPDVAPLIAIATTPFLRPDMSVCDTPGYDAATGIYYQPSGTFPPIIEKPTRADALEALTRLRLPFAEFPYATEAGKTVVIAHAMTLVVRPSFDTSPVFMYPAPIQGTGKTLIVRVISILALGNAAAERPWAEKEELRKVLMSILVAGDVAVLLDNVPDGTKIHSAELARFVTSPTYADRILGRSENKTFPNRTTVSITGNNISGVGDMARRALVAELDADAESALGRPFTIKDLPAYILEHRAQLVVDVLTIIRAYHVAGRPNSKRPTESFEQWSQLIRDPLIWLGMVDPIETQETGTDDTLAPLKAAFAAMAEATAGSGRTFTATQLAGIVTAPSFGPNVGALRAILLEAKCSEPADPVKLGYWLRGFKGRVAGDWKLIQSKTAHGGGACWQLVERKKVK
jgi:hypothetical protein